MNLVIGLAEFFIVMRILLKLFGASTIAPFVTWIYSVSDSLIWPFIGMFPSSQIQNGFVIEFSALFALLVYAFLGYLFTEIISYIEYHAHVYRKKIEDK